MAAVFRDLLQLRDAAAAAMSVPSSTRASPRSSAGCVRKRARILRRGPQPTFGIRRLEGRGRKRCGADIAERRSCGIDSTRCCRADRSGLPRDRPLPIAVTVQPASATATDRELAERVRQRLTSGLGDRADADSPDNPDAVVIAGEPTNGRRSRRQTRIDRHRGCPECPEPQIGRCAGASRMLPGVPAPVALPSLPGNWQASRRVSRCTSRASNRCGRSQVVARGRDFHRAPQDLPPSTGTRQLRVSASPTSSEATESDNRADLAIQVVDRKLRVLVHEPRPSWQGTFVRRALEGDPRFEIPRPAWMSKGIAVRTGEPPQLMSGSEPRRASMRLSSGRPRNCATAI